jgi:hypothetical protein
MSVGSSFNYPAAWTGARLVWNAAAQQLLLGAQNATCSLIVGMSPSTLSPLGPAACVAAVGSLASVIPTIDAQGYLFFLSLDAYVLQFTFSAASGLLQASTSPSFPAANVSLGFRLLAGNARQPGGVLPAM